MARLLSLRLLGGFALADTDGNRITLRRRKARAMFAYLALRPGQPHSRERIAGLHWGDMRDARARMNLRQTLRALRRDLGRAAAALEVSGDSLMLWDGAAEVDVLSLQRTLNRSLPDPGIVAGLYGGPLLDGFDVGEEGFDGWLVTERMRLERDVLAALRARMAALASTGEPKAAARVADLILRIDVADETAHRHLIRHFAESGAQDRAIRQYQYCRRALRSEFDAAPAPETDRLYWKVAQLAGTATPEKPHSEAMPSLTVARFNSAAPDVPADDLYEELLGHLPKWQTFKTLECPANPGRYHLSGTLTSQAESTVAAVRLTESATGRLVWAERFAEGRKPPAKRSQALARRIAQAVATEIEAHGTITCASGEEADAVGNLVFRANSAKLTRTRVGAMIARRLYQEAFASAPDTPRAPSGFAGATIFATTQGWLAPRRHYIDEAAAAIERAILLAPRDAAIRATHSCILLNAGAFAEAIAEALRAVDLNPANAFAHAHLGLALQSVGDIDRAVESLGHGLELAPLSDPRSEAMRTWFARALLGTGEYGQAIRIGSRQVERTPGYGPAYLALATALLHTGDATGAAAVVDDCRARVPGFIEHRRNYQECRDESLERHLNAALFA